MSLRTNLSPVEDKRASGKECRAGPRFRVLLNAELISTTDEQPVRVRDISTTGAMIDGQRPIAQAKDVILRRGSIEIFASVKWTSGNEGGLEFDEALTEADMMAFVREPVKRASFVPEPFRTCASLSLPAGSEAPLKDPDAPIGSGIFGR